MLKEAFNYSIPDEQYRNLLLTELKQNYPFVTIKTLSESLCFRNIDYIQIGNRKNMVLLAGAFHGMEWLTSLLLIHFAKELCFSVKNQLDIYNINICNFLKNCGVIIIPCLNPDGVEISIHGAKCACRYQALVLKASKGNTNFWQANARGVDINHNFDADWCKLHQLEIKNGITGPAPTRFGGLKPESEPESKAIANLCRCLNIRHAIAFHSQGEEIYWHYGKHTPVKSQLIAKVMCMSSGYKMAEPEGLAIGGGFKDWFICKLRKPAFTLEIGLGKNPLPLSDLPQIYDTLKELMVLSIIM